MLWADYERREDDLQTLVDFFVEEGYSKTSDLIKGIMSYMRLDELPSDFQDKWAHIVVTFREEYTSSDKYKQDCYEIIEDLLFTALFTRKDEFYDDLLEIFPIIASMRAPTRNMIMVLETFKELDQSKYLKQMYLGMCFIYQIIAEGIFDEWMRVFNYLLLVKLGAHVPYTDVQDKKLWTIRKEIRDAGYSDTLFTAWKDNHIRNSIAHSRFSFESNGDITFVDVNPNNKVVTHRERMNYGDFLELIDKLLVISDIPERILLLARINDLFKSSDPYKN
jgi:hypothetical protein